VAYAPTARLVGDFFFQMRWRIWEKEAPARWQQRR